MAPAEIPVEARWAHQVVAQNPGAEERQTQAGGSFGDLHNQLVRAEAELVSQKEELATAEFAGPVVAVEEEEHSGSCHPVVLDAHP